MTKKTLRFLFALSFLMVLCTQAGAARESDRIYRISVDREIWAKWGFQYPVTYIFAAPELPEKVMVRKRDNESAGWKAVKIESESDFFNGIECVRVERDYNRLFVSAGFTAGNSFELKFARMEDIRFVGVARYYDNRRAAYTLSLDNWGFRATANPGAEWHGSTDDRSDKYQAALHVCRDFHLPVSIAINSCSAGSNTMWDIMQKELDLQDSSWEPAVHARTHPGSEKAYGVNGYKQEILGCRDDILQHLNRIPFGRHIFEHILTSGYCDKALLNTDISEFLFVRAYNGRDNPSSRGYASWDIFRKYYGPGGLNVKDYDRVFARRNPKGRFFESDVAELNAVVDSVLKAGEICYVMWHPDRYQNSVLYDPTPGQDGVQGSILIQHLNHVANRKDIWYVANGWLYSYRYVADNVSVTSQ